MSNVINKIMSFQEINSTLRNYFFILLGFSLSLSAALISILMTLITLSWILDSRIKTHLIEIRSNPVYMSCIFFLILHMISFLWLEVTPINALKSWMIFLIPILGTSANSEIKYKGIMAFLLGMMLSELYVYGSIFQTWDQYTQGYYSDEIFITMGHISYNPFLAIAISLVLITLLNDSLKGPQKIISLVFLITMIANMFMTGGRAGHVAFIFSWLLLSVYFLHRFPKKLFSMILALILIILAAWNFSPIFKDRVKAAESNISAFIEEEKIDTSVGLRLHYTLQSLKIFLNKPLLGHGTGSFENEYSKNSKNKTYLTSNPHNNHVLVLVQFGLFGFLIYMLIFVTQLRYFYFSKEKYKYRPMTLLLPLFFILINFYDSYLWGHHTQALFAYLTAIFYNSHFKECQIN